MRTNDAVNVYYNMLQHAGRRRNRQLSKAVEETLNDSSSGLEIAFYRPQFMSYVCGDRSLVPTYNEPRKVRSVRLSSAESEPYAEEALAA